MTSVRGLNHITLAVRDVSASVKFYEDALGLKLHKQWRGGAYLSAGDLWLCLSQDDEADEAHRADYTHLAFDTSIEEFDALTSRIKRAGGRQWKDNRSEGMSFYFLDLEGHKLELHVGDLQSRLAAMPC